ncbi:uncharacterized protein FOMMEDRAFT_138040 [Fomitiporia mediterranea MF3/22]|uniref:uncharacterized protein n=1 Tax=Fomitiporia mediterranea (strain MF3/22) TaxID=694068 RepID=UPI0004407FB1|nr:uncharacterized protein FOMMEDRAFT_138040 [Fomitiporia mediterranea MF3/22]EJD07955.1 hypothetical protein FOMMEDRAFT_138040 [Fomitiporia mediterranea MF3/22]
MVGLVDPNPPKHQPERPQQQKWWIDAFMSPIQVKRPAQGKYSPKVDERCLTWCSQTVRGRNEGQDPWCRSVCIRRVFEHEVRQITSHFSHDAAHHSRTSTGKGPLLKYPLPPEGQRGLFGDDTEHDGGMGMGKERDEKYWEEGWYVWMTKSRWAAQEKMDLMMLDLEKQAEWVRMKEQEERAWAESEAQMREREGHEPTAVVPEGLEHDGQLAPLRHPYPNTAEESFLMRIPTRFPVGQYAQQTLSPTWKVLSVVRESFENGHQKELAIRTWGMVRDGTPFTLVRNVFKTFVDSIKKGPKDEDP